MKNFSFFKRQLDYFKKYASSYKTDKELQDAYHGRNLKGSLADSYRKFDKETTRTPQQHAYRYDLWQKAKGNPDAFNKMLESNTNKSIENNNFTNFVNAKHMFEKDGIKSYVGNDNNLYQLDNQTGRFRRIGTYGNPRMSVAQNGVGRNIPAVAKKQVSLPSKSIASNKSSTYFNSRLANTLNELMGYTNKQYPNSSAINSNNIRTNVNNRYQTNNKDLFDWKSMKPSEIRFNLNKLNEIDKSINYQIRQLQQSQANEIKNIENKNISYNQKNKLINDIRNKYLSQFKKIKYYSDLNKSQLSGFNKFLKDSKLNSNMLNSHEKEYMDLIKNDRNKHPTYTRNSGGILGGLYGGRQIPEALTPELHQSLMDYYKRFFNEHGA